MFLAMHLKSLLSYDLLSSVTVKLLRPVIMLENEIWHNLNCSMVTYIGSRINYLHPFKVKVAFLHRHLFSATTLPKQHLQ